MYDQAQAALKQQNYPSIETTFGPWTSQIGGGDTGHSNLARSAAGANVQTKSLQDEADRVRSQSDQLKNLLGQLQYVLFEPVPSNASESIEKDNPSTIEGNLQHAARTLSRAILSLENILAKIGGR